MSVLTGAMEGAAPVSAASGVSESAGRAPDRPVDLVHLSRYTMGDRGLETELLGLFRQQARVYLARMENAAGPEEWQNAAHSLKGSAKAVGAWAVAAAAEAAEAMRAADVSSLRSQIAVIDAKISAASAYIDDLLSI
ncbi:Hpt domain-containing protein [Tepidicaulis sp. LMO-SS28]|uniref:Hpt domain-containing protein n=1 Tax=Tepidicaulis sp. LMO-SS28 TaxID=3447455 RepID=UPI003EE34DDC